MTRGSSMSDERMLLEAALTGLELQRQRIEEQIQTVRVRLRLGASRGGGRPAAGKKKAAKRAQGSNGKRVLSEAARKRIAAAQKRRWAKFRKAGATPAAKKAAAS